MDESAENSGETDYGVTDDGGRARNKFALKALLIWAVATFLVIVQPQSCRMAAAAQLYTNTFSVRLHGTVASAHGHVDEAIAHQVAKRAGSGFENVGKVHTDRAAGRFDTYLTADSHRGHIRTKVRSDFQGGGDKNIFKILINESWP